MPHSTVMIIVFFAFLMIAVSFGIGIWAKKKATTAQAYFGGTAMFGHRLRLRSSRSSWHYLYFW